MREMPIILLTKPEVFFPKWELSQNTRPWMFNFFLLPPLCNNTRHCFNPTLHLSSSLVSEMGSLNKKINSSIQLLSIIPKPYNRHSSVYEVSMGHLMGAPII